MKKYYQLVLIVITSLSLLCFVFYKHEYDRLRKVLEVLDFFGTGKVTTERLLIASSGASCSVNDAQIYPDYWQQYDENLQFYSAYKISHDKGWSINSLAVIQKGKTVPLDNVVCAIVSGDASADKFEGTIEWKQIGKSNETQSSAYIVTCNVPELQGDSHLILFFDGSSPTKALALPLHVSTEVDKYSLIVNSLCVIPTQPYWQPKEVVRFVSYYASLGIGSIYLYHQGISTDVVTSLNKLVSRGNQSVMVHLLLWNSPSKLLDFDLIQSDCVWRHGGRPGSVITLQMGHYFVPHDDSNLSVFLKKLKPSSESTYQARIETHSYCSNTFNLDANQLTRFGLKRKKTLREQVSTSILGWSEPPSTSDVIETVKIDPLTAKMIVLEHCPTASIDILHEETDPITQKFTKVIASLHPSL